MSTAGEKRIPRDVSSALRAFLFATDLYRNGRRACSWLRRTLQWLSDCYRVSGGKEEASRRATRSFSLIYLSCWKLQRRHYPSASYRYRFKVHAAFSHRAPNAFENSVEEKLLYLDIHIYWTKFLFFLFFFFFYVGELSFHRRTKEKSTGNNAKNSSNVPGTFHSMGKLRWIVEDIGGGKNSRTPGG